jgi:hypothetical protein
MLENQMVFHERQSHHDSCRMHALHSVLGGPVFGKWTDFVAKVCDEFDRLSGFPGGTSRGVTPPGFMEFAVQRVHRTLHATCFLGHERDKKHAVLQLLAAHGPQAKIASFVAQGLLVFDREHVWAVVHDGSKWVTVDSLRSSPGPCSLPSLLSENTGFYLVTKDQETPRASASVFPTRRPTFEIPFDSSRPATQASHGGVRQQQQQYSVPMRPISFPAHSRRPGSNAVRVIGVLHAPYQPGCGRVGVRQVDQAKGVTSTRLT